MISEGELGYEARRQFGTPANAFGHGQPSTGAGSGQEYLLGVSRNRKGAASLSEFEGTNFGRDCKHSGTDRGGFAPHAYHASCGHADVHIESPAKTADH